MTIIHDQMMKKGLQKYGLHKEGVYKWLKHTIAMVDHGIPI
jgi:hypothetical protein